MKKQILLSLMALVLVGCGNKSKISGAVESKSLAEQYGDGTYLNPEVFYPLMEIPEQPSLVPNAGPIFSGIARTFMNIGVGLGAGKTTMTMVQPLPEIPRQYVKDVRLKRVFFYIEPHDKQSRRASWWRSIIHGKGNVDFDFLSKVGMMVNSVHLDTKTGYTPLFPEDKGFPAQAKMNKTTEGTLQDFFKKKADIFPSYIDTRSANNLLILKYDQSRGQEFLKNDEYGDMFIAMTDKPADTRSFFEEHPKMQGLFEHIYILDHALMIQLKKDPIITESFNVMLSEARHELDDLGVGQIEQCTYKTCMDLKVPDVSLIDIATRDNALRLDVFMEAGSVPETFRLQGFIEFKAKVISPF